VCAHARGREELAARLFGLADWVASENRVTVWPPPEERDYATVVSATQGALGSIEFAHATVEGEGMSIEETLDLVRSELDGERGTA
jgi:hypothetical protein